MCVFVSVHYFSSFFFGSLHQVDIAQDNPTDFLLVLIVVMSLRDGAADTAGGQRDATHSMMASSKGGAKNDVSRSNIGVNDAARPTLSTSFGTEYASANHVDPMSLRELHASIHTQDVNVDQSLERLYAGVQRLGENARGIRDELREQDAILDSVEENIKSNETHAISANVKLRRAMKKMGKCKICTYLICLAIVVVLIVVIIFLAKSM